VIPGAARGTTRQSTLRGLAARARLVFLPPTIGGESLSNATPLQARCLAGLDWSALREEVAREAKREPVLATFLERCILQHPSLEAALSYVLASKLGDGALDAPALRALFDAILAESAEIRAAVHADLRAIQERDPALHSCASALLYYKGFHALEAYRMGNWLHGQGRGSMARHLQNRISEVFAVDIHPAARIGVGVFLDHGTGIVIGETAVVGDDVSILQDVTLGGTGKETGDRHPKVQAGVMIGAGAKVLGNIVIGAGSKVAAGSVVLHEVPAHSTVAGVPARVVGQVKGEAPALEMDQRIDCDAP
jgi:serine O-acetyltransferase